MSGLPIVERPVQFDAVAADEPNDPPSHRRQQARHLDAGRRHRGRNESLRTLGLFFEDALGHAFNRECR
jgi:hypothetical protein